MSQQVEISGVNWSELGLGELPTGVVTLLLADVEGSTRLWETHPEQMSTALAQLDRTVTEAVGDHDGVRPVEQGEGDSFVVAFARASDALGCALALARAPLDPIRLRIGIHTGEAQLRDAANYMGPTINRTARLRDLAHGGQVVLSAATTDVVIDALPQGCWVSDLGSHRLRDLPRPERVTQLCHPELRTQFPPLRTSTNLVSHNLPALVSHNLPASLTSFVGRRSEIAQLCQLVADNRLVTLTGAGGAGKTRLAVQVAAELADAFDDGLCFVDLAPITIAALVPIRVARTLGLSDQPGRSTTELLVGFVGNKSMLVLVDNCEHLLDACSALIVQLLQACPRVRVVCTSREPLGVPGELTWRVPSLSIGDEALELFTDRARLAWPEFELTDDDDTALVARICQRLDGMPLAIELAAARVRALSLPQIAEGLHDRFQLLTGGARTAVRRQQTLRASVDWSHALLTEPERVLFRRLAAFTGGFDLDAAHAVGANTEAQRSQLLDHLTMLVDKSLVVADHTATAMRYRLLETVRQYAHEKLGASGEAAQVRTDHRDHYSTTAAALDASVQAGAQRAIEQMLGWAQVEINNLRAAFAWSRDTSDHQTALGLVSSLQPFWLTSGRFRDGLTGFEAILTDQRPQRWHRMCGCVRSPTTASWRLG